MVQKKGNDDYASYHLRVINTMSYITSNMIRQTLDHYLGKVHVAKEDMKYIKMKNEFHYSRLIVTYAKKSYVGLLIRQEAHVFEKPKIDVKGVNFFKSTASEKTSEFIYQDILMDQLLAPKSGKVSLRDTYRTIYQFQKDIADQIKHGDMGFLKRSIKVKSPDAYANPLRVSAYKAVWLWNQLVEEKDMIKLPSSVTLVKVVLNSKKDAAVLERWPDIYHRICWLFDHDPEIGDSITPDGKVKKGKGIKTIAMPGEYDEVPEWLLAIIDVETLVSDNMNLFTQLYRPLGLSSAKSNYNGSSMTYYTSVVRI